MDPRSQQPMINSSGSGRKRNKENQSDASLAGIRQQGSGNALDLFLQRRAESIKRSRTIGTSSEFDKNSRATRRARLSNFNQNPSPGSVLDSTVTNVMPSTNAATAIGRSPLSRIDQNANHGVLLDSTVTGVKRRGRGPSIETLFNQSKKSSTSGATFSPNNLCHGTLSSSGHNISCDPVSATGVKRRGRGPSIETLFKQSKKSSTSQRNVHKFDT